MNTGLIAFFCLAALSCLNVAGLFGHSNGSIAAQIEQCRAYFEELNQGEPDALILDYLVPLQEVRNRAPEMAGMAYGRGVPVQAVSEVVLLQHQRRNKAAGC